jgi:hypothetical protein
VLQNLYSHPVQMQDGTMVTADENYLRESILTPAAKVTAGYQPVMPAFQGPGQRGTAARADRVCQVAVGAAGKRESIMEAEFRRNTI